MTVYLFVQLYNNETGYGRQMGAFLDAHGSVVAHATGFDVCADLPQVSAIAAFDNAYRLSPLTSACLRRFRMLSSEVRLMSRPSMPEMKSL